jgi:glucose-6-phosphate isomerase
MCAPKRIDNQKGLKITLDFNNLMAESVQREGIHERELKEAAERSRQITQDIKERRVKGLLPFMDLPYQKEMVREIKRYAKAVKAKFTDLVVLGIGGSALGGITLHNALHPPFYNLLSPREREDYPRIFFAENIDPDGFKGLLDLLDMKKTLFNVISKSGETAETMAQFLIVRELLVKKVGTKKYKEHLVITTDAESGWLRQICSSEGLADFTVPRGVGGRFSVLSPVGLLPAVLTGIDCEGLLSGARFMDKLCKRDAVGKNPAAMLATALYLLDTKRGKRMVVMMPYCDALKDLAYWFRQLWAESLGKRKEVGPTPINALGVTDQHSQLQLYMEGPLDKVIIFIAVKQFHDTLPIPKAYQALEGIKYLGSHTLNELIDAERMATEYTLVKNKRANCTITLPELNAFTLGQLLYLLEVATVFAGSFYQVNPFDQPGVEEGKKLTYGIMGRKGFEGKRREIKEGGGKLRGYII